VPGIHNGEEGSKFDGSTLDRSILARPLIDEMAKAGARALNVYDLIVDLNLRHRAGLRVARELVYIEIVGYDRWHALDRSQDTEEYLQELADTNANAVDLRNWGGITSKPLGDVVDLAKARYTPQYVYPKLTAKQIEQLVVVDGKCATRTVYRIWPDFDVEMMLTKSTATVKATAARSAFNAAGEGVVWAVADTGIDATHPHFAEYANLDLSGLLPLKHIDFSGANTGPVDEPTDPHGHGTHVAGIIAGESPIQQDPPDSGRWEPEVWAGTVERDQQGDRAYARWQVKRPIAGVAPMTKLVSLRVLDKSGTGKVSSLLAAIGYVQDMNDHGRMLRIHGVNMSVGYGFDPEWFGCGQSPLCVEVDRLVHSGVSVVVAAGNTGYWKRGGTEAAINSGLDLTINDPGNAQEAITVGSTHRDKPHTYGISYFSSKGPTGDGRLKPDVVAPGEKILSCAAGTAQQEIEDKLDDGDSGIDYRQESGTSMAAPHVSGCIAAFLSARNEFIGHPLRVKEIITRSATDLGRDKYFQGHGLVDLMRAMQSV
jgi:subtilisin family serine protease